MIVYKCSSCGRIFLGPSSAIIRQCRGCGGWLSSIDKGLNLNTPSQMGAKRSKEGGDASRTTIAHTALRNNDQREALSTISVQERLEAINSLQDLPLWKNVPFLHPGSIERQAQRKNTESTGAAECTSKEQATPEANQNFSPVPLVEENLSRGEGSQTLTQKCAELDILIKRLQHSVSGMSKMPVDPRALRWQGILSPYPRILYSRSPRYREILLRILAIGNPSQ